MAQILDKQGLQHYANKMCNADNRKVGSKSLPTALNEIDTAIDGFKTLFETEYGTPINMELTNNQNIFTVGTSTDIDKKDDVENSFTDLTLNGNSLVNCIKKGAFSNSSNFTAFENNPIVKGEKITLTSRGSTNQTRISLKPDQGIIKPNTKYTFIFNIFENTLSGRMYLTYTNNNAIDVSYFPYQNFIEGKSTGQFKYVLTSTSDVSNVNCLFRTMIWNDSVADESITFSVMILEGDYTNKPIPQYFEGMKSVGQDDVNGHKIEILSRNKNLFNINDFKFDSVCGGVDLRIEGQEIILNGTSTSSYTRHSFVNYLDYMKDKTTYTLSGDYMLMETTYNDGRRTWTKQITTDKSNMKKITVYLQWLEPVVTFDNLRIRPMLEEGNVVTVYATPSLNKKEISLNEPLRGLPNGVKDTIEKINGEWKIVRRCAQVNVNGSEHWNVYQNLAENNKVETISFASAILPVAINNEQSSRLLCNNFIGITHFNKDVEGVFVKYNNDLRFSIKRSKLVSEDVNGFKEWLSQNPTKVIYELVTPIIEDISPVTLQCWKNGTISIDEILPVETTHTVALNKSAQIQKNIEELSILRNRVKALEEQYDKTALNQAYEVELLRLDMQLDNII